MWCADLSEELSGEVDTLEIIGSPAQILVSPAGQSNYDTSYLSNIMAMSPAQAGLAWALLPGWQKWRPTYRVGTISDIDYLLNTGTVTLDDTSSVARNLKINQADVLPNVPVKYMDCNAEAFVGGNRVVVEFDEQLWGNPKVVGFETNPQPCGGHVYACGTNAYGEFSDLMAAGQVVKMGKKIGDILWRSDNVAPAFVRTVSAYKDQGVYAGSLDMMGSATTRGYLAKYDPGSGTLDWSKDGLWGVYQVAATADGVAVGSSYTLITGIHTGFPNYYFLRWHAKIEKYSHEGTKLWERNWTYNTTSLVGGGATHFGVSCLVADEEGNFYAGGIGSSGESFRKLNGSTGATMWELGYNVEAVRFEIGGATMGRDGKVYAKTVAGNVYNYPTGVDFRIELGVDPADYRYVATDRAGFMATNILNSQYVSRMNPIGHPYWTAPVGFYVYQVALD
jgi:hypothetical protein